MTEIPKVEMEKSQSRKVWGKSEYQTSEKFKLTSTSVFWILAPLFMILPWVIYLRNRDAGARHDTQFSVPARQLGEVDHAVEVPAMSTRSSLTKPSSKELVRKYVALKIVGAPLRPIPPGAQVKGILVMGASNGPVKVKTTESLILDGEVLLDSGMILIGQARSGEDRLFVAFSKMVSPDGTSKEIAAQGYDVSDMIPGIKGSKVRSRLIKLAAAASLNLVGGLSEGLQDTQSYGGIPVKSNSFRNAALNGASHAALDQGKSMLESAQNDTDVIEVKVSTPLWIVFGGDN